LVALAMQSLSRSGGYARTFRSGIRNCPDQAQKSMQALPAGAGGREKDVSSHIFAAYRYHRLIISPLRKQDEADDGKNHIF